ncbi:primase-helicase family protein [Sphaerotilaceae bacterium SBD11-9]
MPNEEPEISVADFYAYMPNHTYLHVPTGDFWPAASVNGRLAPMQGPTGKSINASAWLDVNRPIEQVTWHPSLPRLILDRVVQISGWVQKAGARVYNLYCPGPSLEGDPTQAGPWLDHLRKLYPDEAEHLVCWLAHRLQCPGQKVNHALVLGGAQGIGKDTLLDPIKAGVGSWNWQEISPTQMLGRFNGWCKAVVVRISEARDLGDTDRFAFYDHSKGFIAAPPDVIRCDEKHLREHAVPNVCGVVITTNHRTDGLYLPADDRRHFVAWSEVEREHFSPVYWHELHGWYANGGAGHVVAYLKGYDLSGFDPKAPPPKTAAFWSIVQANEAPEDAELRDVLDKLGQPRAVTLDMVADEANRQGIDTLANDLRDRKAQRSIPHKMERAGYVAVRNPDAKDGFFACGGKRRVVYALQGVPMNDQIRAARDLLGGGVAVVRQ